MATWKEKYNKKYNHPKTESHTLSDISKDTGVSKRGLQKIYNKGIGAWKTNIGSVRLKKDFSKNPNTSKYPRKSRLGKEQWAMARVYSAVMGGKASKVDAKELKMQMGGSIAEMIECYTCDWSWKESEGGEDKYVCHKCGTDNTEKYMDKSTNDFDRSEFYRGYYERLSPSNFNVMQKGGKIQIDVPMTSMHDGIDEADAIASGLFAKGGYVKKIGNKLIISDVDGNEYVYSQWANNNIPYLIPYIDTKTRSKKYWEHFNIPKDSWIDVRSIKDYSIYPLSKNEFEELRVETTNAHKKILEKYQNSFAKGGDIGDKIRLLKSEGYPQKQAVAIALDMKDRGKFEKGGQTDFNPDGQIKDKIVHASGQAGGMLVGKRHSKGGIKAINKSTGQPLEMEGGEVVITRDAVSDNKKRSFNGKMMTNRQILSAINESGGGVSFADGGQVPNDLHFDCNAEYEYGGKTMCGKDLAYALGGVTTAIVTDPNEAMADLQSTYGFGDVYDKGGDVKLFEYPLTSDDREFLYNNALISVEKDDKVFMIGIILHIYSDMLKLKPLYISEDYSGATIESSLSISEQILIDILNGNPQSVNVFSKMEYLTDINNIKGLTSFQIETARKILKAYFDNLSINFMEFFEKTLNPNAPDVQTILIKKSADATSSPFSSYNALYKNYIQGLYVGSQYGNRIKFQVNDNTVENFEFRVGRKKVIKKYDNSYWRIGNGKKIPPYYDFLLSVFGVSLEGYSRTNYNYIRFIDPSKTSFTEREQELKKAIDKLISEGYKVLPVIDLRNQNLQHLDIVNEETGDVDSIIIDEENKKILLEPFDASKKQFYLYQKLGFIAKKIRPQDVTIVAPLIDYSKQKNYLEGRIKALATELELKKVALSNEQIAFYLREIKLFTRKLRELNQTDIEQNDTIKKRLELSFNKQWGDINQKYTPCKFPSINGKPSQLTKEEFITVRTENFKLFFGDWEKAYEDKNYINVSKVINDVTKEPLAVYHGTNVLFTNWKTYESNNAHYFTVKREMANFFATSWDSRGDKAGVDSQIIKKLNPYTGEFIYRCFLDIRNPIDFSRFGVEKRPIKDFLDFLKINYNIYDFDFFSNLNTNKEKVLETKVFAWQIIRMWQNFTTYIRLYTTYDGYVFYEYIPDSAKQGLKDASLSFCTFDSDQNKFANSNEFNSLSLDSRFEKGGKI